MAVEMGKKARMIAPVIQGDVIDTEYDKSNKCLRHLLSYVGADGEQHERWFPETQLEEVTE